MIYILTLLIYPPLISRVLLELDLDGYNITLQGMVVVNYAKNKSLLLSLLGLTSQQSTPPFY